MSTYVRSKKLLESRGYIVAKVEHWNAFAKIRQDLFGFIDALAIKPGKTLAVQTTDYTNVSHRVNKIHALDVSKIWRAAGNHIEVHGWFKKNNRWDVRIVKL